MKSKSDIRLALIFKDFAAWVRSSCVGLNVAGFTTAQVLNKNGVDTVVFPVRDNMDVVQAIDRYNETHEKPLTHVVISAPWLTPWDLKALVENFSQTQFVVLSHSNVGFLQADPDAVWNLSQYHKLSKVKSNLHVGGNSSRLVEWLQHWWNQSEVAFLPNLYPLPNQPRPPRVEGCLPLQIGAFGAVRPYKNFMTAAAAAVAIHRLTGMSVDFHMSTGGECGTISAIEQVCGGLPGFRLIKHDWQYWDDFIRLVRRMDLLIQVSYTESFNLVTADGILAGVPSVVSSAITWAPDDWKADADDAMDVARVGIKLLRTGAAQKGHKALLQHNARSLAHWFEFLLGKPEKWYRRLWFYLFGPAR